MNHHRMKTKFQIHHRLTHQYNTAYDYLDEWAGLTHVTEKRRDPAVWIESKDGESGTTKVLVVLSPAQLAEAKRNYRKIKPDLTFQQAVRSAIEGVYAYSCECTHDCCGHWFGHGSAVRVKPREWMVTIHRSMNL